MKNSNLIGRLHNRYWTKRRLEFEKKLTKGIVSLWAMRTPIEQQPLYKLLKHDN